MPKTYKFKKNRSLDKRCISRMMRTTKRRTGDAKRRR